MTFRLFPNAKRLVRTFRFIDRITIESSRLTGAKTERKLFYGTEEFDGNVNTERQDRLRFSAGSELLGTEGRI